MMYSYRRKKVKMSNALRKHLSALKKRRLEKQKEILQWAAKYGRLPVRFSSNSRESILAGRMHNYISQSSDQFDASFRNKVHKKYGIKQRIKRKHDVEKRRNEVLSFVKKHGRVPSALIEKERQIYTTFHTICAPAHNSYDPKTAEEIKSLDRCHKTYIPKKYRRSINEALGNSQVQLKVEKTFTYGKNRK